MARRLASTASGRRLASSSGSPGSGGAAPGSRAARASSRRPSRSRASRTSSSGAPASLTGGPAGADTRRAPARRGGRGARGRDDALLLAETLDVVHQVPAILLGQARPRRHRRVAVGDLDEERGVLLLLHHLRGPVGRLLGERRRPGTVALAAGAVARGAVLHRDLLAVLGRRLPLVGGDRVLRLLGALLLRLRQLPALPRGPLPPDGARQRD